MTGFNTKADVKATLSYIEEKLGYEWYSGKKATEDRNWERSFDDYQGQGGFAIRYEEGMSYAHVSYYEENYEDLQKIVFSELIASEEVFKEGEEVYVSDDSIEDAIKTQEKRIYLCTIPGNVICKHVLVAVGYEGKYKRGEKYAITHWKCIAHIPKQEEMTIDQAQAALEKALGKKVKIIN